jgi:hypothetical protein
MYRARASSQLPFRQRGSCYIRLGALGQQQPRTAHSFMPEFESEILKDKRKDRLPVE